MATGFEWLIPAAGSIVGSIFGGSSAESAANAQAAASNRAADLQYKMYKEQQRLQEPFRQAGMAGQNRLLELLGLTTPGMAPEAMRSEEDIRKSLLGQYTTPGQTTYGGREGDIAYTSPSTVNEDALDAAVQKALDQQNMLAQAQAQTQAKGPDFGKYARDFGMSDFQADPGYAFRLAEGQKALERQAAARGGLISGSALKAAQRYGQEAGSQEYMNAFNRYQTNRANQLNPLQSLANQAQTAAGTLGSAAGQYGSNMGNLYSQMGENQGNAMLARGTAYQRGFGDIANIFGKQFGSSGSSNPFVPSQPYDVPFYGPQ